MESGGAGGFAEKLGAARDAGAIAVVIGRPRTEVGLTYNELVERLTRDFGLQPRTAAEGSGTARTAVSAVCQFDNMQNRAFRRRRCRRCTCRRAAAVLRCSNGRFSASISGIGGAWCYHSAPVIYAGRLRGMRAGVRSNRQPGD